MNTVQDTGMAVCVNHSERPATHACYKCAARLCFECMEIAKGRHYCAPCAYAIDGTTSAVETPMVTGTPDANLAARRAEKHYPRGILPATAYGLIVGLVAAILWEKIAFVLNHQWFYEDAIFGAVTGAAIVAGYNKGGIIPGLIGLLISVGSVLLSCVWLAYDLVQRDYPNVGTHIRIDLRFVEIVITSFDTFHWVMIAIWIVLATAIPYAGDRQQRSSDRKVR